LFHCTATERAYWLEQAQSARMTDAWAAYQHALDPQTPCITTPSDTPCPECERPMERLTLPDGRVESCPDCGYRNWDAKTRPPKPDSC